MSIDNRTPGGGFTPRVISSGTLRRMSKQPTHLETAWFMKGVLTGVVTVWLALLALQAIFSGAFWFTGLFQ